MKTILILLLMATACQARTLFVTGEPYRYRTEMFRHFYNRAVPDISLGARPGALSAHRYYETAEFITTLNVVDGIIFGMGRLDSYEDNNAEAKFARYQSSLIEVFDLWKAHDFDVQIMSVLPTSSPTGNDRIDNWYNPWLAETAQSYDWTFVDTSLQLDAVSDWEGSFLRDDDDRFLSSAGRQWFAEQAAHAAVGKILMDNLFSVTSEGDLTGDGMIDVRDWHRWRDGHLIPAAVPESISALWLLLLFVRVRFAQG